MKRSQLIEWGIVVIALIFGYKFFDGIIALLMQLIYGLEGGSGEIYLLKGVVTIGIYVGAFALLIKNSRRVAEYLSGPADASTGQLAVKIRKRSMLQVILIGICLATILSNIADIIYYVFTLFKKGAGRRGFEDPPDFLPGEHLVIVKIIGLVVAVVIIAASKNISEWLVRKNEADELVFDSTPEK